MGSPSWGWPCWDHVTRQWNIWSTMHDFLTLLDWIFHTHNNIREKRTAVADRSWIILLSFFQCLADLILRVSHNDWKTNLNWVVSKQNLKGPFAFAYSICLPQLLFVSIKSFQILHFYDHLEHHRRKSASGKAVKS